VCPERPYNETPVKTTRESRPRSPLARVERLVEEGRAAEATELVELSGAALVPLLEVLPQDRVEALLAALPGSRSTTEGPWLLLHRARLWGLLQRRHTVATVALRRALRLLHELPEVVDRDRGIALAHLAEGVLAERDGNHHAAAEAFAAVRRITPAAGAESWHSDADADRWRACDPSGAMTHSLEAIPALRAMGDGQGLAPALHNAAMELLRRGEPVPARRLALQALEIKRATAPDGSIGNTLNTLGMIENALGNRDAARSALQEAASLLEAAQMHVHHAYALGNLAEVERDDGAVDVARALYERSLSLRDAAGDEYGVAYLLRSAAVLERRAGGVGRARELIDQAIALREPLRDGQEAAELICERGLLAAVEGDVVAARVDLGRAAAMARTIDAKAVAVVANLALALLEDDAAAVAEQESRARALRLTSLVAPVRTDLAARIGSGVAAARARGPEAGPPVTPAPTGPTHAHVLGRVELVLGGRAVDFAAWRSRRAAELVRLLISRRSGGVSRDQLVDWLWPDVAAHDVAARLHATLTAARRGLEAAAPGDWIVRTGQRYRIAGVEWVDADALLAAWRAAEAARGSGDGAAEMARLSEAAALCAGEPYPDDSYREWPSPERELLAEVGQQVRERRAELALERGDHDLAVMAATEAVSAEPGREIAHQLLIRAHRDRGDRASAMRALAACGQALRAEVGVEPSSETLALLGSPSPR
jgi:DNA-binding SARP family transcriptional activator/tetratricopeptide (TPR) repeat protein